MRITLQQTGSKDDLGKAGCCLCHRDFYLGPVTCWAISERSNILWGEVCPACIEHGPEHIQRRLDMAALGAQVDAQQRTETAEEGVTDCPTLDQVLAAEAFYERPRFETSKEYEEALDRGEVA
jgi:hypothetical protein